MVGEVGGTLDGTVGVAIGGTAGGGSVAAVSAVLTGLGTPAGCLGLASSLLQTMYNQFVKKTANQSR